MDGSGAVSPSPGPSLTLAQRSRRTIGRALTAPSSAALLMGLGAAAINSNAEHCDVTERAASLPK